MLRTLLTKTLFEKRWVILTWFVAVLIANFGISLIFPPIRDTMGSLLGQIPDSMKNWFGDAATWQTFEGFAGQEIFGQMSLMVIIMAIVFGASFLAGDEERRITLTVLSRPMGRLNFYLQKYMALVVFILITTIGFYTGAVLGGLVLGQPVPFDTFAACTLVVFLHSLALGTITFAIGAITGKKSLAGMIVGFYAFLSYFIASLSTATDIVDKLSYGALYRYANAPEIIASGLDGHRVLILVLATLIPLVIAAPIFLRRDLKTR